MGFRHVRHDTKDTDGVPSVSLREADCLIGMDPELPPNTEKGGNHPRK